jgi:hypothetical protein
VLVFGKQFNHRLGTLRTADQERITHGFNTETGVAPKRPLSGRFRRSGSVLDMAISTNLAKFPPFSRRHHDRRRTSRSEGANGSLGAGLSAGDRDKTDGPRGHGLLARRASR